MHLYLAEFYYSVGPLSLSLNIYEQCVGWEGARVKGTSDESFGFCHKSSSPGPSIIQVAPFQISLKIHKDNSTSECTADINDTASRWPPVLLTLAANLPLH